MPAFGGAASVLISSSPSACAHVAEHGALPAGTWNLLVSVVLPDSEMGPVVPGRYDIGDGPYFMAHWLEHADDDCQNVLPDGPEPSSATAGFVAFDEVVDGSLHGRYAFDFAFGGLEGVFETMPCEVTPPGSPTCAPATD